MKKLFILLSTIFVLASCGSTKSSALYYWGGTTDGVTAYEKLAYNDYKTKSPKAICQLIAVYEDMVKHPGGTRKMPPPGICAEYGYLLFQNETFAIFNENATTAQKKLFEGADLSVVFKERGKEMLAKEIEYYPESKRFIEPLLKKVTGK